MARNTNFYYSFLVLTPARRQAIVAVWDFCRAIDDAVDEARVETEADRVAAHARARRVAPRDRAVLRRRRPGVARRRRRRARRCSRSSASSTCRAGRSRIWSTASHGHRLPPLQHFAELYQYCYRVASTVGIVCVEIFGCQDAPSRDYAVDLGIALQLTNILRDVKRDLARPPLHPARRSGALQLHRGHDAARHARRSVPALLRPQAARAREYYDRATRAMPPDESRRLVAAEIMRAIYRAILDEIELRDFDVFSEMVRVSGRAAAGSRSAPGRG